MRINIVTINLNNKKGLERTIQSVTSQTFFDIIDYIIIDGGSTDGSKEVIESVADKLHYWCSEQDNGIFNAMNKSLEHLTGDYVLFLNSGDHFNANNVVQRVCEHLDGTDIVYGNELFCSSTHSWTSTYPATLNEDFFRRSALPHQSTFIKVELMKAHPYREDRVIAGDWTFFREAIMKYNATYKYVPMIVSNYYTNGISGTQFHIFVKEKNEYYTNLKTNENSIGGDRS